MCLGSRQGVHSSAGDTTVIPSRAAATPSAPGKDLHGAGPAQRHKEQHRRRQETTTEVTAPTVPISTRRHSRPSIRAEPHVRLCLSRPLPGPWRRWPPRTGSLLMRPSRPRSKEKCRSRPYRNAGTWHSSVTVPHGTPQRGAAPEAGSTIPPMKTGASLRPEPNNSPKPKGPPPKRAGPLRGELNRPYLPRTWRVSTIGDLTRSGLLMHPGAEGMAAEERLSEPPDPFGQPVKATTPGEQLFAEPSVARTPWTPSN